MAVALPLRLCLKPSTGTRRLQRPAVSVASPTKTWLVSGAPQKMRQLNSRFHGRAERAVTCDRRQLDARRREQSEHHSSPRRIFSPWWCGNGTALHRTQSVWLTMTPLTATKKTGRKDRENAYQRLTGMIRERTSAIQAETAAEAALNPLIDDYGFAVEEARARRS